MRATKAEVTVSDWGERAVDVRNMSVVHVGDSVQDFRLADGQTLITTANGVAPSPELAGHCLWLREDGIFTWEIVDNGCQKILIARYK